MTLVKGTFWGYMVNIITANANSLAEQERVSKEVPVSVVGYRQYLTDMLRTVNTDNLCSEHYGTRYSHLL